MAIETTGKAMVRLVVPAADTSIRRVRRAVEEALCEWGLGALVDDAVLVASELATNSVRNMHSDVEDMFVCFSLVDGKPFLEVWDSSDEEPVTVADAGMGESGRGLLLVEALAEDWGFRRTPGGGKWVYAVLPGKGRQD